MSRVSSIYKEDIMQIINLIPILFFAMVLLAVHYGQPEEYRYGECTENSGCPAANSGIIDPCPYFAATTTFMDAEIEVF